MGALFGRTKPVVVQQASADVVVEAPPTKAAVVVAQEPTVVEEDVAEAVAVPLGQVLLEKLRERERIKKETREREAREKIEHDRIKKEMRERIEKETREREAAAELERARLLREGHERAVVFNQRALGLIIRHGLDQAVKAGQTSLPVIVYVENYKEFEELCVIEQFSIIRYNIIYLVPKRGNTCWRHKISKLIDDASAAPTIVYASAIPTIVYVGSDLPKSRFVWGDSDTIVFEWECSDKLELPRYKASDEVPESHAAGDVAVV